MRGIDGDIGVGIGVGTGVGIGIGVGVGIGVGIGGLYALDSVSISQYPLQLGSPHVLNHRLLSFSLFLIRTKVCVKSNGNAKTTGGGQVFIELPKFGRALSVKLSRLASSSKHYSYIKNPL